MSSGQLKCQECDQEFTLNQNLIRHVKTVHGNKARKDNEARKEVILKLPAVRQFEDAGVGSVHQVAFQSGAYLGTSEEPGVGSVHQVAFKSPA